MEQTFNSIIVIDDERTFANRVYEGYTMLHCRSVGEALAVMVSVWNYHIRYESGVIAELWFDHDLGDDGGNINVVVDWLCGIAEIGHPFPVRHIMVHSQNPVGAESICKKLERYYNVKRVELPELV
jgi:hypothetical protein